MAGFKFEVVVIWYLFQISSIQKLILANLCIQLNSSNQFKINTSWPLKIFYYAPTYKLIYL